jgi:hypothetical protein
VGAKQERVVFRGIAMEFGGFFKRWRVNDSRSVLRTRWTESGVCVEFGATLSEPTSESLLAAVDGASAEDSVLAAYLSQLVSEGHCELLLSGALLSWDAVYQLQSSTEHLGALHFLNLPPTGVLQPILDSMGTLSDPHFSLTIASWTEGQQLVKLDQLQGAVATVRGEPQLLPRAAWQTLTSVNAFSHRGDSGHGVVSARWPKPLAPTTPTPILKRQSC